MSSTASSRTLHVHKPSRSNIQLKSAQELSRSARRTKHCPKAHLNPYPLPPPTPLLNSDTSIRSILGNDKFTNIAKADDPPGRFLLHDEYREKEPNEYLINELIRYFPDRASRRNASGDVPLHIACLHIETVEPGLLLQLLTAYPEGPTVANHMGNLPFHKAVTAQSVEAGGNDLFSLTQRNLMRRISMVMEAHPEALSVKNVEGQIPLHVALTKPKSVSLSVVSLLLEYYPEGAMEVDAYGHLPLHKVRA
jgi:ankyrin repeat protein